MESLRAMLRQIADRFALLDTSQRVAMGLCAVVIAGSLIWLTQWSTAPELVPVLAQDMTLDQLDTAEEALAGSGIRFERMGGRLLVRPEDKYNAIRILNKADALPQETSFGFAELLKRDTTFAQSSVLEHERLVALSNELARVIESSPAVADAAVFIQHQTRRTLGQSPARSTASVKITTKPNQPLSATMVDACAKLVSHAVPGLSPHDVTVFDARTLQAHSIADPEDALGQGLLEERKKNERHLLSKVLDQLAFIPGVLASVSVELDSAKVQTTEMLYGDAEVKSEETRSSRSGGPAAGAEPGVNPNTGVALSSATGSGGGSETEEGRSENYEPKLTGKTVIDKPPFTVKRATAAVNVPRSYVAGVFKARFPDKADFRDTDREFLDVRNEVFTGIRDVVGNIIMAQASDVQVDMFHDVETVTGPALLGSEGTPAADSGVAEASAWKSHLPEIGLGGLALLSLTMMLMMVRKTTRLARAQFGPPAEESAGEVFAQRAEGVLSVGGGPVGRAEVSEGFLVGQEVDPETLQLRQYDEQVARMVDDDPQTVADLLRRWVEQKE